MLDQDELVVLIEDLKKQVKNYETVLRLLKRKKLGERTGSQMRYYKLRPQVVIQQLLRANGPATRESMTKEMVDGGITVGNDRGEVNIRTSFDKQLRKGSLKEVNGLIGFPEWPDEKFVVGKPKQVK